MAKRRPNGDGMVRKRGDGRWEGRIVVGHKNNGKPIYRYALAKTQKELTEKLHTLMLLHEALDTAVRDRLIVKNPTARTVIPKTNYAPKQILNNEQLDKFMSVIKEDKLWYDFFYTELTTGLRRGEICGLKWENFDSQCRSLKIQRTITRQKGGGFSTGETKTETGTRTIMLPPSTAELLKARKETSHSEWIFPNFCEPEKPMAPDKAYTRLKMLLKKAGLPSIRFHDLRHTFATHALAGGVDAKTLSGILGHTNASFTLDTYTHVTKDMQRGAADIIGNMMNEITGVSKVG